MNFKAPLRSSSNASTAAQPTPWESSVEVDLHLILALSRASVNVLLSLSPQSADLMREALAAEVETLRAQDDPHSLAAVGGVLELLQKAA